jgi:hypothetical protein
MMFFICATLDDRCSTLQYGILAGFASHVTVCRASILLLHAEQSPRTCKDNQSRSSFVYCLGCGWFFSFPARALCWLGTILPYTALRTTTSLAVQLRKPVPRPWTQREVTSTARWSSTGLLHSWEGVSSWESPASETESDKPFIPSQQ